MTCPGWISCTVTPKTCRLPTESFDAVINVEASHAYPRLSQFLAEVVRVLRPGGHFLYADFRGRSEFPGWEAALADTEMQELSHRVINPQVLRALEKNSQRSLELIARLLPTFLRPFGRRFAGVPGTGLYRVLRTATLSTGCIASPNSERPPHHGAASQPAGSKPHLQTGAPMRSDPAGAHALIASEHRFAELA